jgi:hypothetical protein
MAAIQAGPNLADPIMNAALNLAAPDPGPLAAGAIMTTAFCAAKRLRCEQIAAFGGTAAEIEESASILHEMEHGQMGAAAAGNLFYQHSPAD